MVLNVEVVEAAVVVVVVEVLADITTVARTMEEDLIATADNLSVDEVGSQQTTVVLPTELIPVRTLATVVVQTTMDQGSQMLDPIKAMTQGRAMSATAADAAVMVATAEMIITARMATMVALPVVAVIKMTITRKAMVARVATNMAHVEDMVAKVDPVVVEDMVAAGAALVMTMATIEADMAVSRMAAMDLITKAMVVDTTVAVADVEVMEEDHLVVDMAVDRAVDTTEVHRAVTRHHPRITMEASKRLWSLDSLP